MGYCLINQQLDGADSSILTANKEDVRSVNYTAAPNPPAVTAITKDSDGEIVQGEMTCHQILIENDDVPKLNESRTSLTIPKGNYAFNSQVLIDLDSDNLLTQSKVNNLVGTTDYDITPGHYSNTDIYLPYDSNLIDTNIVYGKTIYGVTGKYSNIVSSATSFTLGIGGSASFTAKTLNNAPLTITNNGSGYINVSKGTSTYNSTADTTSYPITISAVNTSSGNTVSFIGSTATNSQNYTVSLKNYYYNHPTYGTSIFYGTSFIQSGFYRYSYNYPWNPGTSVVNGVAGFNGPSRRILQFNSPLPQYKTIHIRGRLICHCVSNLSGRLYRGSASVNIVFCTVTGTSGTSNTTTRGEVNFRKTSEEILGRVEFVGGTWSGDDHYWDYDLSWYNSRNDVNAINIVGDTVDREGDQYNEFQSLTYGNITYI